MLNKLELLDIATYQRKLHPVLMSQNLMFICYIFLDVAS